METAARDVIELARGVARGTLRVDAPPGTTWAMLRCGAMYRQLREEGGTSFPFEQVPKGADCRLALGDGEHAWVFDDVAADEVLTCRLKARSMRCTSTKRDLVADAGAPP